ncbi:MAG TPA: hypothetical protein VHB97_10705, partial [Polyangia bacterium]|nr:hypothetical protein [Polyangia bacterium]
NNTFTDHFPATARFSPDGTRLVYINFPVNSNASTYQLITTAADGSGPIHVIRSSGVFGLAPPIWVDNNTVAWVENDSTTYNPFTIFKAADANATGDSSATRTQILRCDQSVADTLLYQVNQFALTDFGMIVAGSTSFRSAFNTQPEAAVQLYKLPMNDCSTTNAVTLAAEPVGGLSWDFSVSPDGLKVLFSSTGAQAIPDGGLPEPQSDIFLVPSDGSAAAQKFLGDPAYNDSSPRYVAAGRQILWSRVSRRLDMGADVNALMIANADGTHERELVPTAGAGETVRGIDTGTNHGLDCDFAAGAPTAGATAFALLMLGLVVLRLRRRS